MEAFAWAACDPVSRKRTLLEGLSDAAVAKNVEPTQQKARWYETKRNQLHVTMMFVEICPSPQHFGLAHRSSYARTNAPQGPTFSLSFVLRTPVCLLICAHFAISTADLENRNAPLTRIGSMPQLYLADWNPA
jgi:hypothetical protein